MSSIDFFTALKFNPEMQTCHQSLIQNVDGYFYLGGRKAQVIDNPLQARSDAAYLVEDRISRCSQVALIISYLTVFIPLIMLLAKLTLRLTHDVKLLDSNYSGQLQPMPVSPIKTDPVSDTLPLPSPMPVASLPPPSNPAVNQGLKAATSKSYNPNHAAVKSNKHVKGLLDAIEGCFGKKDILSFTRFDTQGGTKIHVSNCVPGHTVGFTHERHLLIDGQKVEGGAYLADDCYAIVFEHQGKLYIYDWDEAKPQMNMKIGEITTGIPPKVMWKSAQDFFSKFAIPNQIPAVLPQLQPVLPQIYKAAPSIPSDPHHSSVLNNSYVQGLMKVAEDHAGKRTILSFTTFDTYGGTKIRVANCVSGHAIEIADDNQRTLLIDGQKVEFAHHRKEDCYALAYEDQGKIYILYWDDKEKQIQSNYGVIDLGVKPLQAVWIKSPLPIPFKPAQAIVAPPSVQPTPQTVSNPQVNQIKEKLEFHGDAKFDIATFEVFVTSGGKKITIANCMPGKKIEIADDVNGTLILDGKATNITNHKKTCYFACEFDQQICLYKVDENESLNGSNRVFMGQPGIDFKEYAAKSIFPTEPAASSWKYPTDPAVVNVTGLRQIREKVEKRMGQKTIQNFETFTAYGGYEMKVANTSSYKVEIACDQKRMILVNGKSIFIENSSEDAYFFAFEDKGTLYIYCKEDREAVSDDNSLIVLAPGQTKGRVIKAKDFF